MARRFSFDLHANSTVHIQLMTGDVISICNQERCGFGYFLRLRKPLQGDSGLNLFESTNREAGNQIRSRVARRNDIGRDVELCHL